MVGMKSRAEEATTANEKSKTIGTVLSITMETRKELEDSTAVSPDERTKETRTTWVKLGDLMTKLNDIDIKLKCS